MLQILTAEHFVYGWQLYRGIKRAVNCSKVIHFTMAAVCRNVLCPSDMSTSKSADMDMRWVCDHRSFEALGSLYQRLRTLFWLTEFAG